MCGFILFAGCGLFCSQCADLFCLQRADFFVCSVRTFLFAACEFFLFAACGFILFAVCRFIYLLGADLFCSQCEDLFSLQCILFCEMCNFLLYGGILPGKMCPLWASVFEKSTANHANTVLILAVGCSIETSLTNFTRFDGCGNVKFKRSREIPFSTQLWYRKNHVNLSHEALDGDELKSNVKNNFVGRLPSLIWIRID